MATEASNKFKRLLAAKLIDFTADTFRIALMQSGFSFNKDTHTSWSTVSSSELSTSTATAYTSTGGSTLSGVSVTEDTTSDKCSIVWSNVSWNPTAASLGPTPGAIIYDTSVTSTATPSVASPIIAYIDFGGDQTQVAGGTFVIVAPEIDLV